MNPLVFIPALMRKREILYILTLTFFVFLSTKALFHEGFFRTIDDITTVRIDYLEKELRRNNWFNNFPVRLSGELSNNYGYPLYLFYSPLTYYAGAIVKLLLGLSNIVATKYVYVFPLLFGPFAFYFAARQKMPSFPALVASILFTLFPYRGSNTYFRGAVAEAWAISFIPLAFAGLFLLQRNRKIGSIIFAASLFLILISHNLTGALFVGFVLLYGLLFLTKNKDFWRFFILGLGLSAFFLLPMLYYSKIIRGPYLQISTTYILQTLEPLREVFKIQIYKPVLRISGVFFYILISGLIFFINKKLKGKRLPNEIFFWGIAGLVSYLLLFEPFKFIWQLTLPIIGILQYVWRLLSLLAFIIPLFLGFWLAYIKNSYFKVFLSLLAIAASLNFLPIFRPEAYSYFYEYKLEGICATTSNFDEFLPIWVKEEECPPPRTPLATLPEAKINILSDNSLSIKAEIAIDKNSQLIVNKYYFPGWHVFINGKDSPLDYRFSIDGIFRTSLSPGQHKVEVIYKKTLVMWLSDLISIGSFGVLFYFLWRMKSGIGVRKDYPQKRIS